jgi:anti-anti-sigma regulatory factor
MFCTHISRFGDLAIVECEGSIGDWESVNSLRDAVTSQQDASTIVVDLSRLTAIEDQSLGMLLLLQKWTCDRGIALRFFNPGGAVRDRLAHTNAMQDFEIVSLNEMLALLRWADSQYVMAA